MVLTHARHHLATALPAHGRTPRRWPAGAPGRPMRPAAAPSASSAATSWRPAAGWPRVCSSAGLDRSWLPLAISPLAVAMLWVAWRTLAHHRRDSCAVIAANEPSRRPVSVAAIGLDARAQVTRRHRARPRPWPTWIGRTIAARARAPRPPPPSPSASTRPTSASARSTLVVRAGAGGLGLAGLGHAGGWPVHPARRPPRPWPESILVVISLGRAARC